MSYLRHCLLFFLTLTACCSRATPACQDPPITRRLTVATGLPQSFVNNMVQDSSGFIWIATKGGLARYDGRAIKKFIHVAGEEGLADNVITNLYLDSHGYLWICFSKGEIDVMNVYTERLYHFTRWAAFQGIANNFSAGSCITEDARGAIWIRGIGGQGVYYCDIHKPTCSYMPVKGLTDGQGRIVGFTRTGANLLLICDSGMVALDTARRVVAAQRYTFSHPHLYNPVRYWKDMEPVVRARTGEVVMVDEERVIVCDPTRKQFTVLPLPHTALYVRPCILQDGAGNVFIGAANAVYRLDTANSLRLWRSESAELHNPVSLLIDHSGMLWVGGNASGMQGYDLRLPRMTAGRYEKGFVPDAFRHFLHVPEAVLGPTFLGNTEPYLLRWTPAPDGGLWISQAGNDLTLKPVLLRYKDGQITSPRWHYADADPARHKRINAIAVSRSGQLWGVDFSYHLIRLDEKTGLVTVLPPIIKDSSAQYDAINSFVMDGEDTCWITSGRYGLIRHVISTGSNAFFLTKKRIPISELTCMIQDRKYKEWLWIGTLGGGLVRYNKATNVAVIGTTTDGLLDNTVYGVLQDRQGTIWGSTNNGLFYTDTTTVHSRFFQVADGLPGNEFNRFHFLQREDGQLLFGGVDGYVSFDPAAILTDDFRPAVALTGISINNRPADYGAPGSPLPQALNSFARIQLPYDQNFLSFRFAGLEYNIPEKLQYRYRLEGLDGGWVDAGTGNTATYTAIPPGHYTLKVNASNTAGIWSDQVKTLEVIITPPFWLTWWFTALWVALAAALLIFIFQRRTAAIHRKAQERIAFERNMGELEAQALRAQMNPHFIFNCLNSIKSLIQRGTGEQAVSYLTTFAKLIRNQLNNAGAEISLYEELETCRLYTRMEALRFGDKLEYEFCIDEGVDTAAFIIPPLIIQPLVENAIWHGILPKEAGGRVTISVRADEQSVHCIIEDDGIGRAQAAAHKTAGRATHESKGMHLIEKRLELYNLLHERGGAITITDKADDAGAATGTIVTLTFKKPQPL